MAEFYAYVDAGTRLKKILKSYYGADFTLEEVYSNQISLLSEEGNNGSTMILFLWEQGWWRKNKPYYRIYPKMIQAMCRLNIDKVMANEIAPPDGLERLLIEMPKGNKLMDNGTDVQFMFIDWLSVKTPSSVGGTPLAGATFLGTEEQEQVRSQLSIGIHYGEMDVGPQGELMLWDIWRFPLEAVPVGDQIAKTDRDILPPGASEAGLHMNTVGERRRLTSLALTLMMLEDDPDIVLPDVLAADRSRANKQNRDQLAAKARKRGRNGWTIGEEIEHSPHTRAPHMATFHVGEGRRRTIVKRRKGSIVHREKVVKTPTGYKGSHDAEV